MACWCDGPTMVDKECPCGARWRAPEHWTMCPYCGRDLRLPVAREGRPYDLWFYDRGEEYEETRYVGPFTDVAEARDCASEEPDGRVRRCRRVPPPDGSVDAEDLRERLDQNPESLVANDNWAKWDDSIVELEPGAQEALDEWARKYIRLDVYECEPDGPVTVSPREVEE